MNRSSLSERLQLSSFPTPLERMENLSRVFQSEIYVKRDDLISPAGGGNKVRKLEFLLADALRKGARSVLTIGAMQSNHCRQTALLASRLGMKPHLILMGEKPDSKQGNFLLFSLAEATLHFRTKDLKEGEKVLADVRRTLQEEGEEPYLIPYGGSNHLGVQGYTFAWKELLSQSERKKLYFDFIIIAASSGGTQAGLLLGQELFGGEGKIIGISVGPSALELERKVESLYSGTAEFLKKTPKEKSADIRDEFVGPGYGQLDPRTKEAISVGVKQEALLLDPVYTGKAFAGMLSLLKEKEIGGRVLFWHTGGIPALYNYASSF